MNFMNFLGMGFNIQGEEAKTNAQRVEIQQRQSQLKMAKAELARKSKYESWRSQGAMSRYLGTQRNIFANAGVEMEYTPVDVLAESAKELTLDRLMQLRNAKAQQFAYSVEQKQLGAAMDLTETAGTLNIFSQMLGGASKMGNSL